MYIFDPDSGKARRAGLRGMFRRLVGAAAEEGEHLLEAAGLEEHTPDPLLVQRIRSEIGHIVAHAHDIGVEVHHGHVVLSGAVRRNEIDNVLRRTWSVKGVKDVLNRLEVRPLE